MSAPDLIDQAAIDAIGRDSGKQGEFSNRPVYRSSAASLRKFAAWQMLFAFDPKRRAELPPLAAIGVRVADLLTARERTSGGRVRAFGEGLDAAIRPAGVRSLRGCTAAERRALAPIIMAKAGRRESDSVALFSAHPKLQRALLGTR